MTRQSKVGLALIFVLAGAVVLIGGSPAASQRQVRPPVVRPTTTRDRNPDEQAEDPYADIGVLVESFVIEIDLSALYEMGVSPLGQAPHAVSVENILECLKDPDTATVVTGAKAVGVHRSQQGRMRQSKTTYRAKTRVVNTSQGPRETVDYSPYENGQSFEVWPSFLSEDTIALRYDFTYSGVRGEQQSGGEAPPDSVSWSWNGSVSVTAGKPLIVGATQDEDSAVFLILTAHIIGRT
jgi:hypothetical protein